MNPDFTDKQALYIDLWAQPPYKNQTQVAKLAGVTPKTVSDWKQDPAFVAACEKARATSREDFKQAELDELLGAVPKARRTMVLNLAADSETVRQQAAAWILERMIGKAPGTVRVTGADGGPIRHVHVRDLDRLSDDELDTLESIALRLAGDSGAEGEA